jgi:hypothetical protein
VATNISDQVQEGPFTSSDTDGVEAAAVEWSYSLSPGLVCSSAAGYG